MCVCVCVRVCFFFKQQKSLKQIKNKLFYFFSFYTAARIALAARSHKLLWLFGHRVNKKLSGIVDNGTEYRTEESVD